MPILESASKQDIARLLELFPVSRLKEAFSEFTGTKEKIAEEAAKVADAARISRFVTSNLAKCKQHTFVFTDPSNGADFLTAIPGAQVIDLPSSNNTILLTRVKFSVLLKDPYEDADVEFLWPMRILKDKGCIQLSVVVLERSPYRFFTRESAFTGRNIDEKQIIENFVSLGAARHDLHKGVKSLWNDDFMDAFKIRYKKPFSVATEEMDEDKGIKANNPPLFAELQTCTLFSTLFRIPANQGCSVEVFHVDPSTGALSFSRYTEGGGDADEVVSAILDANS